MIREASNRLLTSRPHLIPALVAAAMLVCALGDHPYGYYQLLRLVVTASAAFVAWIALQDDALWAVWLFVLIALLFQPFVPVHLGKPTWRWVDPIAAGAFLTAIAALRRKHPTET